MFIMSHFSRWLASPFVAVAVIAATVCLFAVPTNADEKNGDGFEVLFDGETLNGWDGNPMLWSVVDGVIHGETSDDTPIQTNEFLIWDGNAADFHLVLEFRVADRGIGNSGVQYRSKRLEDVGRWVAGGYQADIERTNKYMGIAYEERGRGILAMRGEDVELSESPKSFEKKVVGSLGDPKELVEGVKPGEWQTLEIIARGNRLEHKINGRMTAVVTDNDVPNAAKEGIIALQLHQGPAMQIDFRNIRLKKFPAADAVPAQ